MKRITGYRIELHWSDGKTEGIAPDLPEYLHLRLCEYFRELEDLREEHDEGLREEPYNFEANDPRKVE